MERRTPREWLRELLLTTGAVVGGVCLLAAVGSIAFGLQPLIFRSGSMEPTISTGALALARDVPAETVQVGDVVSVVAPSGTRITHRVVSTSPGPVTTLILKGDANRVADTQPYAVSEVALVVAHVDYLGYVVSWLRHPAAIFAGGVLVGVLVMIAFTSRGSPPHDPEPPSDPDRADFPRAASPAPRRALEAAGRVLSWRPVAWLTLGIVVATVGAVARDTSAAFADTGTAASGSFSTLARIPAPVLSCSTVGLLGLEFTWTAVAAATGGYDLTLTSSGGASSTTSYPVGTTRGSFLSLAGTGTAVIRSKVSYANTTWYSLPSNTKNWSVLVVSSCT